MCLLYDLVQSAKAFLFVDTTTGELTSGGMNAGQDILYHEDFWIMQNTFKRLETRMHNLEERFDNVQQGKLHSYVQF